MIKYVYIFLLMLVWGNSSAQDPLYSLSFENKALMNPSLIGRDGEGRIRMSSVHRNLYRPMNSPLNSTSASFDYSFCNSVFAIGINAGNETQGSGFLKTNSVSAILGMRKNLQRGWTVNGGLMFGAIQQNLDWGSFVFSDQINPILGPIYPSSNDNLRVSSKLVSDLGFGFDFTGFGNGKRGAKNATNFGLAVMHLTNSTNVGVINNYVLPRRFTGHINWIHRPNAANVLGSYQVSIRYDIQGNYSNALIRFNYTFLDALSLGCGARGSFTRNGNIYAPLFNAGVYVSENLNIHLLYESAVGVSRLTYAGSTFEIGLIYRSVNSFCLLNGRWSKGRAGQRGRTVCPVFNKTKSAPDF